MLAAIDAVEPILARTSQLQVADGGNAADVARQRNLREWLNDLAGPLDRGVIERDAAFDIEQLLPFRQAKELTTVMLTLAIPSDSLSCQQEPSDDETRINARLS